MTSQLTDQEKETLRSLSADERYDHLVATALAARRLWILCDEEGFVMVASDEAQCIPIWPQADCAAEWATDEWASCQPLAIDLDVWHERWTSGLQRDGIDVAVFPSADDEVVVVSPSTLGEALAATSGQAPSA